MSDVKLFVFEIKYLDKVIITKGFYEGTKGIVLDVSSERYLVRLNGPSPKETQYHDKWVMKDDLALQETEE